MFTTDATVIDNEESIHWERDPSELEYIREYTITTTQPSGASTRLTNNLDKTVYGWANVDPESDDYGPTSNRYKRRYWALREHDKGGSDYDGETWENKTPMEAVDPTSITVGEPSKPTHS